MSMRLRDKGFTLIEIMVSIAVVAIIVGIVYESFFNITEVTESINNSDGSNYQMVMLTSLIRKDFFSIYTKDNKDKKTKKKTNVQQKVCLFSAKEINLDSIDDDKPYTFLTFCTTSGLLEVKHPLFIIKSVSYAIRKKDGKNNQQRFILIRGEKQYADLKNMRKTDRQYVTVADNIVKIKVSYIDKNGNEYLNYNPKEHNFHLPAAVLFNIEFLNSKQKKSFFKQLFLLQ